MKQVSYILIVLILFVITAFKQEKIITTSKTMDKLEVFRAKEKFVTDTALFYPGVADQTLKPVLTAKINSAADDFKALVQKGDATEKEYHEKIIAGLQRFNDVYYDLDTEDRERICHYFEELMDIVGLKSSDGLLNEFNYEFIPTK